MKYANLPIDALEPDPDQPRRDYLSGNLSKEQKQGIEELAGSIKAQGVLEPLLVAPLEEGRYRIVAGERRWRAAAIAGIEELPCLIREPEEGAESGTEQLAVQLSENLMREDMSDFDVAEALARLREQGMSRGEIAELLGQNPAWVSTRMTFHREAEKAVQAGITSAEVWSKFRRLRPEQQSRLIAHREETGEPITSGLIQRVQKEGVAPDQYAGPTTSSEIPQTETEDEGEALSFEGADDWAEEAQVIEREAKETPGQGRKPKEAEQESRPPGSGYRPVAQGEPDPESAFEGLGGDSALDAIPESDSNKLWYSFGFEAEDWAALVRFCGLSVEGTPDRQTIKEALEQAIKKAP